MWFDTRLLVFAPCIHGRSLHDHGNRAPARDRKHAGLRHGWGLITANHANGAGLSASRDTPKLTLFYYADMIEESARHVGHADILREQTDGATGFDG
jgi:hypothetical protein